MLIDGQVWSLACGFGEGYRGAAMCVFLGCSLIVGKVTEDRSALSSD